jgi:hypothetical protein
MVCPWLDNGDLNKYLERHKDALTISDRFRIVSPAWDFFVDRVFIIMHPFAKLCDVAAGLSYRE